MRATGGVPLYERGPRHANPKRKVSHSASLRANPRWCGQQPSQFLPGAFTKFRQSPDRALRACWQSLGRRSRFSGHLGFVIGHGFRRKRQLRPSAQHLANAPSLRDAALWRKRSIAVVDFSKRADSIQANGRTDGVKKSHRCTLISIDAKVRQRKWPQQPTPRRTLVIRRISLARPSAVVSPVRGLAWRQTAQTVRRQQALRANIDHSFLLRLAERTNGQRHGKNLVGPQRIIVSESW